MALCPLCNLASALSEKLYYEDRKVIAIECPVCSKPVIIAKEHKTNLSEQEAKDLLLIAKEVFGDNVKLSRVVLRHAEWEHEHWHVIRYEAR